MGAFDFYRVQDALPAIGENTGGHPRLNPRAELVTIQSPHQWVLDGKAFVANIGSATTPINFAETAYDADQPQIVVRVPAGTGIIPLELTVVLEDSAGTDNEIIWAYSQNDIGAGTSSAVTDGPDNLRADAPNASACTVLQLYTGNATAATNQIEFSRDTYAFADATTDPVKVFRHTIFDMVMPVISNPTNGASLIGYVIGASTAPQGYAIVKWAEFSGAQLGI